MENYYNLGRVCPLFKGNYDSTATYHFLDIVLYNGSSYVVSNVDAEAHEISGILPTDSEYWDMVAQAGTVSNPTQEQIQQIISTVENHLSSQGYVIDGNYVHTDNNFTNEYKNKLDSIAENAMVNVNPDWNETNISSDSFIKNKPQIIDASTYVRTDNNFTNEYKNKLDSIAENAMVNVNPDWNSNSGYSKILNKPTIPVKVSDLRNDSHFVSDDSYNHTDNNFTGALLQKLNGIEEGAETNVNPDWLSHSGKSEILNKPENLVSDANYVHTDCNYTQDEKDLVSEIDNKANVDGYYQTMTVGMADSLTSHGAGINRSFSFDTTGGSADVSDGLAVIDKYYGKSIVWNQKYSINSTSSTHGITYVHSGTKITATGTSTASGGIRITNFPSIPIGHKIFVRSTGSISGFTNISIYNYRSNKIYTSAINYKEIITTTKNEVADRCIVFRYSANVEVNAEIYIEIIDLTLMFGAGNEPSTVAEFEKLFPLDYYPYNAGQIINFNGSGIYTEGFNLYNPDTKKANLLGNNQYQITGTYTSISYKDVNGNTETITKDSDGKFTPSKDGTLTVVGGNYTDTCIHLVWSGYRNNQYETYWNSVRNLPDITSIMYQGEPLFPDGLCGINDVKDEITSKKAIKRIGKVDLGSLDWNYTTNHGTKFYTYDLNNLINNSPDYLQIKYAKNKSGEIMANKHIYLGHYSYLGTKGLFISDSSYSTATAFKAAMNGVYLYYELATPIEVEFPTEYNLTYKVSDFGIEKLLPYGTDSTGTPQTTEFNGVVSYLQNIQDAIRNHETSITTLEDDVEDLQDGLDMILKPVESAPETSTSSGNKGEYYNDEENHILYLCIASNVWVKLTSQTF